MKIGIAKLASALVIVAVLFGIVGNSRGQARVSSKNNVISLDPIGLAYSGYALFQYEFKTGPTNSWALRAILWPARDAYSTAFGLGAAYRIYIADSRALTGLSVAPAADVVFFRAVDAGVAGATIFDIGGDLAYKWIFDQFSVEPMFGLRIGFGSQVTYATGFQPVLALNLGYAW